MLKLLTSFKRAPIRGAFFICLIGLGACANSVSDTELYKVKKVIDGDTLILKNEEKVRFVGINTPELGHGKFRDEPLANQARKFVKSKIEGKFIQLKRAEEKKDRHGRWLAHVYTKEGANIQVQVLERGLGFAVAVGDNLGYLDEYLIAERKARAAKKGVWGDAFFAPISAKKGAGGKQRGYRQVIGKVKRVSRSRNNQTLHMEGDFRVLIHRENWKKFFKGKPKRYVGKKVIARGWLFSAHDVTGMKVYHPSMVEIQ